MSDQTFRLCYQTRSLKSYKRFMWRWDGVVSGQVFQMSRIQINDISLPYTYVTYAQGSGRVISGQPANLLVQAEANSTWCIDQMTSGNVWGWIIFDLNESVQVEKYRIKTGGDTATYPGRNPARIRLYGTNSEATTFDDASWELLSDLSSPSIPTTNMTWTSYFEAKKYEYSTPKFLVGPNRKGLRWDYIEPPAPSKLTIDLNNVGNDVTSEWQSQTRYPGNWTGLKVFACGTGANGSFTTYIKDLGNLSSNFNLLWLCDTHYGTSNSYGRGTYLVDNTQAFYGTCPYGAGQDSQYPRYQKSRYTSTTINVSKGGNLSVFLYASGAWYTNKLYFAIPEELVGEVINSR